MKNPDTSLVATPAGFISSGATTLTASPNFSEFHHLGTRGTPLGLLDFLGQLLRSNRVAQVEEDQVLLGEGGPHHAAALWKYRLSLDIEIVTWQSMTWEHPFWTCDSVRNCGCMNDIIKI